MFDIPSDVPNGCEYGTQYQTTTRHIPKIKKYIRHITQHVDYAIFNNIICFLTNIRAMAHNYKSINLDSDYPSPHRSRPLAPHTSLLDHITHTHVQYNESPFELNIINKKHPMMQHINRYVFIV